MSKRGRPAYRDILTPREWEVLRLLGEGLTNPQIADRLGISEGGAKYHVSQILGKLGVASREDAAGWAERRSRTPALAPFLSLLAGKLSLRPLGLIAAAATVALLVAASASGLVSLPLSDLRPGWSGSHAPSEETARPGTSISVQDVASDGFGLTIVLEVRLPSPLAPNESFAVTPESLTLEFGGRDEVFSPDDLAYSFGATRDRLEISAHFATLPLTDGLSVSLGELSVIPNGGNGHVVASGLRTLASLDASGVGPAVVSGKLSGLQVDTGFGWRYVVDALSCSADAIRVAYHVEGDTAGLMPLPVDEPSTTLPFPEGGSASIQALPRPSGRELHLAFGGAGRAMSQPTEVRFIRNGTGAWVTASLTGVSSNEAIAEIFEEGDLTSVRVTAPVAFTGRGSPGNQATLVDDLVREYSLFHASGSLPPSQSQWDFSGRIDTSARELHLTIPGYLAIENGRWYLDSNLNQIAVHEGDQEDSGAAGDGPGCGF